MSDIPQSEIFADYKSWAAQFPPGTDLHQKAADELGCSRAEAKSLTFGFRMQPTGMGPEACRHVTPEMAREIVSVWRGRDVNLYTMPKKAGNQ